MKMENKKISQNTRYANTKLPSVLRSKPIAYICSLALLSAFVSYSYAGHVISDKKLATEIQGKGQFSQDTLEMIDGEAAKPKAEQQKNSAHKSSRNNKIIQEKQLEGSTASDYLLQKKRAADQLGTRTADVTPVNQIRMAERYENMRVTYPDGVVVEMKH